MNVLAKCLEHFIEHDTDVIIYAGDIDRNGYEKLCKEMPSNPRGKLLLILCTFGGDPNAGYRIARAAIHHYGSENFTILVPHHCKSAGTLICIGASKLIMANKAELGPLDIQLQKQDEIFKQSSGLDILRGITFLQSEALRAFKSYLIDINGGSGLSTKIASEISSKLVIGLYEPLFAQIDPLKLGEMNAALQIAHEYGTRLNEKSKNLKKDALVKLVNTYPTHGFVIDRAEARTLFENVEKPTLVEDTLARIVNESIWLNGKLNEPVVLNFTNEPTAASDEDDENENEYAAQHEIDTTGDV